MSLRLVIPSREEANSELSVVRPWWQFSARFNVAISQGIPVARMHERESEGVMMRWGLAQKSARGDVNFTSLGVIRSDQLQSDQALRTPWLYGQRGIVPLAGFYLWDSAEAGHHQPYYVRLVNRPVFGVAALWDRAETSEGDVIESCALVAVEANPLIAEITGARARMPGVLHRRDYETWLSCSAAQAEKLLQPYPRARMVCHRVGPYVNHLEFDEPALIKPANH